MTVAARIATSAALLILLLVAALSYHLAVVHRLAASNRAISTHQVRLVVLTLEQLAMIDHIEESARKLAATGDPGYGEQLTNRIMTFESALRRLSSFDVADSERAAIHRLGGEWRRFLAQLPAPGDLLSGTAPAERARRLGGGLARLGDLRSAAQELVAAANQELSHQGERAESARRGSERWVLAVFAVALLSGSVAVALAIRAIQRPLRRLIEATGRIAEQSYDFELETHGEDEFARLSAAFNEMAKRLAELDEVKRNLLSHVSHELQTPLASIQESHLLLLDGLAGPLTAEQRHLLELDVASCERLGRLISNLLERSRLDAGSLSYEIAEHDLGAVARATVNEVAARAEEAGLLLVSDLPREPLLVPCDRERIGQVLRNLLDNAVKYSSAGGRIEVSLRMAPAPPAGMPEHSRAAIENNGAFVLLEVADEGPGVPAAERERIFERFYRAQRGSGGPSGVGLGLAICRDLVEAHGGAIWASANSPVGSRFQVLLPAGVPERRPAPAGALAAGEQP
jgi:signal transduction histidine kinase